MDGKKLVIGKYYLVSLREIHSRGRKVGKLINIVDNIYYKWSNDKMAKYLIEFLDNIGGHSGLNHSNIIGKEHHCWYVTEDSIIKELNGDELLAYIL